MYALLLLLGLVAAYAAWTIPQMQPKKSKKRELGMRIYGERKSFAELCEPPQP